MIHRKKEDDSVEEAWEATISELVGKTIVKLDMTVGRKEVRFLCSDKTAYVLFHETECCEQVLLEDINGEISWLVGSPILMADESQGDTGYETDRDENPHYQWTFYRFATRKGYVDLRFLGTSNGYYSEKMTFMRLPDGYSWEFE